MTAMEKQGQIYFVTDGEAIKIGFATNLKKRMYQLQTSQHFPLFLLGSIIATRDSEAVLHRRFSHLRISREWFRIHREIIDFIDDLDDEGRLIPGTNMEQYENLFPEQVRNAASLTDH
jgi:hypothetical protein